MRSFITVRRAALAGGIALAVAPVPGRAADVSADEFSRTYGMDASRAGPEQRKSPQAAVPTDPSTQEFARTYGLGATTNAVLGKALELQNRRRSVPNPSASPPEAFASRYGDYLANDTLVGVINDLKSKTAAAGPAEAEDGRRLEMLLHLLLWNHFALDMTSLDHSTRGVQPVEPTYAEQLGPPRSSRALAIVHLAMFEAVNVIDQKYASYKAPGQGDDVRSQILNSLQGQVGSSDAALKKASIPAAIAAAAYTTLVALYPRKAPILDADHLRTLILIPTEGDDPSFIALGTTIGNAAANAVLALRQNDGSAVAGARPAADQCAPGDRRSTCLEPLFPPGLPPGTSQTALDWRPDPVSQFRTRLGETWVDVAPFTLSKHQFLDQEADGTDVLIVGPGASGRHAKPKDTDADFLASLNDAAYGGTRPDPRGGTAMLSRKYGVRSFGGYNDPSAPIDSQFIVRSNEGPRWNVATSRTDDLTVRGNYWGYDGTALLCAPPRLYNMIATSYALGAGHAITDVRAMARYLALVNLALADAGVAAWDAKYRFSIARPTSFIRLKDPGHVASGSPDGHWTPLGQAATNGTLINISPPFPAYPSGHAVFGGALFQTMARVYGKAADDPATAFPFVSDEYNGVNLGADGKPRQFLRITFRSFEAAEWENAESRIWLGIHWQKDADDGILLGREIADHVFDNALKPLP